MLFGCFATIFYFNSEHVLLCTLYNKNKTKFCGFYKKNSWNFKILEKKNDDGGKIFDNLLLSSTLRSTK